MLRPVAVVLSVFSLLAQAPDQGLRVIVVEGQGAINNIRDRTARAPVVKVLDDAERPVPGATVNFTLPDLGAGGYFADGRTMLSTLTDASGLAVGRGLRPNNIAGRFPIRVTASAQGRTGSAIVSQTNVAPAEASGKSKKKILIGVLIAAGAGGGALIAARGGGKSSSSASAAAPSPGTTITPGSPVFGPPR